MALDTRKNPRIDITTSQIDYLLGSQRDMSMKGGGCDGEVACASFEPIPLRALRPSLVTTAWMREPSALAGMRSADGETRKPVGHPQA